MLIFALWIFSVLQRILGQDEICELDSFSACAPPDTFPLNLPENEIELNRSCSIVLRYMPCVRSHELTCHGSFPYEDQYKKVYDTSSAICKEGSHIHTQLSKSIKCIKRILKKHNDSCSEERENIMDEYVAYVHNELQRVEEELTNEDWDVIFCLHHSYNIGCYLRDIEECGDEAKEVSVFIIRNSGFVLDGCSDDVKRTILFLLKSMDLHYYQEQLIKEVLQMSDEK